MIPESECPSSQDAIPVGGATPTCVLGGAELEATDRNCLFEMEFTFIIYYLTEVSCLSLT